MSGSRVLLTEQEITDLLEAHPGWRRDGEVLRRSYEFSDFRGAFSFMTHVALIAERLFHHPARECRLLRCGRESPKRGWRESADDAKDRNQPRAGADVHLSRWNLTDGNPDVPVAS